MSNGNQEKMPDGTTLASLLKKGPQAEIVNGKSNKYTAVYMFRSAICTNCNNAFGVPPTDPQWRLNAVELWNLAETIHSTAIASKGILCASPKLFILYDNAFVLTSEVK